MKIKLIELLNKIANDEEVPERIKYDNKIMKYDHNKQDYKGYYSNGNGDYLFQFLFDKCRNTEHFINDYVEIIEENKKIEKLENETEFYNYAEYEKRCDIDKVLYILKAINLTEEKIDNLNNKINELIDAVNGSKENYQKKFRR